MLVFTYTSGTYDTVKTFVYEDGRHFTNDNLTIKQQWIGFGVDTDLGNGTTRTKGFTVGINTGF